MRRLLFFSILLISFYSKAQTPQQRVLDLMDYEPLLTLYDEYYGDSISLEKIARTYLKKARKDKDTIKMARGYDRLASTFNPQKNIYFADSIIALTKHMNHITYPAMGYMLKAYEYGILDEESLSVDNYAIAYESSLKTNNLEHQLYILNNLISLSEYWGHINITEKLIRRFKLTLNREDFFKTYKKHYRRKDIDDEVVLSHINNHTANFYINKMMILINKRDLDSALIYSEKSSQASKGLRNIDSELILRLSEEGKAEIFLFSEKFEKSKKIADSLIKVEATSKRPDYLENLYFIKGMSLLGLNHKKDGISYLLKFDSISNSNNILPYQLCVYDSLYKYFESFNNFEISNKFLKKKISTDSVFKKNYKNINLSILEEVLQPLEIKSKNEEIRNLQSSKKKSALLIYSLILFVALVIGSTLYYYNRQRLYAKRFYELQSQQSLSKSSITIINDNVISDAIVSTILKQLESFEGKKGFLNNEMNLQRLAKDFNTNTNYLSRVINLKIGKGFSAYINDLRIDYALEILTIDSKYVNYTIKAIAEECGYKGADSFSRAFYRKTGIYPSFYIKKIIADNK